MAPQFIYNNRGNAAGVFIPIEEWQTLKTKYTDLQKEEPESAVELAFWQKKVVDERLSDYHKNPMDVADFDTTIDDIEKTL